MGSIQLTHYLVLSAVLFSVGAVGFLVRRNSLVALMCIELMLNAVNLTLVAFNRWMPANPGGAVAHHGQVFAFFVIAVAAAEAAVGLAIVLSLYRVRKVVRTDDANLMKE
ncbi:MAG: NADH-quinone oxidoreductase subunit NuoK [Deltaproteobacteria bacterium]|nr:NADH-quinone oxidoreductase subunit NuoK [Deltaproteobacteria bacterium]